MRCRRGNERGGSARTGFEIPNTAHAGPVAHTGWTKHLSTTTGSGRTGVWDLEGATRDEKVPQARIGRGEHRVDVGRYRLQPNSYRARLTEGQQKPPPPSRR